MIREVNDKFDLVKGTFRSRPSVPPRHSGYTFAVADVRPSWRRLSERRYQSVVAAYVGGSVEACNCYNGRLVSPRGSWIRTYLCHPLIEACYRAYTDHRPLRLSPDMMWLTLLQGVAAHIHENAEALRHHFTRQQERVSFTVRRDDFRPGSPKNPWPEVFAEFAKAIGDHVGPSGELLRADFSTTGPVERAAGDAMLMYAPYRTSSFTSYSNAAFPKSPWTELQRIGNIWPIVCRNGGRSVSTGGWITCYRSSTNSSLRRRGRWIESSGKVSLTTTICVVKNASRGGSPRCSRTLPASLMDQVGDPSAETRHSTTRGRGDSHSRSRTSRSVLVEFRLCGNI